MFIENPSGRRGGLNPTDVITGDVDHLMWLRSEVDRSIDSLHTNFINALGPDATPLQVAVDMANEQGRERLDILDVGGGTGHSLRTLVDMATLQGKLDRPQIKGTVLNNNDFSQESASARTRKVIASGGINYLVGDAEELPYDNVPESGFDLVYAYELMLYLRRPEQLAQRLARIARPAGHVLFNALGNQRKQIDIALGDVPGTWDAQSATIECPDARGKTQKRTFYHLIKGSS